MSSHPSPAPFISDERGFTGAERALLIGFGLAIVLLCGALLRGGSGRAAGDAARALASGQANLGALQTTRSLSEAQLIRAANPIPEAGPAPAAVAFASLAGTTMPPRAEAPAPAPEAPTTSAFTVGDTASTKRTFTDAVYKRHVTMAGNAQITVSTPAMKADLAAFLRNWEANRARYEAVAEKTGVPAPLIAALHWRESSGNFRTYLHQGDPLGRPATHVPRNIPVFHKWEEAAIHALNMKGRIKKDLGLTDKTRDLAAMGTYAEYYNGLGYYNKGRSSPYVYSGTNQYDRGKYVGDGVYDPTVRDKQLGVLTMIRSLPIAAAPAVMPTPTAPTAPGPALPRPAPGPARPRRRRPSRRVGP